jgi:hypothetical protein
VPLLLDELVPDTLPGKPPPAEAPEPLLPMPLLLVPLPLLALPSPPPGPLLVPGMPLELDGGGVLPPAPTPGKAPTLASQSSTAASLSTTTPLPLAPPPSLSVTAQLDGGPGSPGGFEHATTRAHAQPIAFSAT